MIGLPEKALDEVNEILNEIPCHNPCVLSLGLDALTDYMIVVGASSSPHARAIAERVVFGMKKRGSPPLCVDGLDGATHNWIVVDFGLIIVHIMQEEARAFYRLEDLWGAPSKDKTLKMYNKKEGV